MKYALIILSSLVALKCSQKLNRTETAKENTVSMTTISKGSLYGAGAENISRGRLIIKDTKTWEDLKSKMNTVNEVTEGFSEKNIDFTKYMVIAVFESVKSSGGHSVGVTKEESTKEIIIYCKTHAPEGVATSIMTQPYIIIKIPRSQKQIRFTE